MKDASKLLGIDVVGRIFMACDGAEICFGATMNDESSGDAKGRQVPSVVTALIVCADAYIRELNDRSFLFSSRIVSTFLITI